LSLQYVILNIFFIFLIKTIPFVIINYFSEAMMNFEVKKTDDVTVLKLDEIRLDTNIAGLLKGEVTILFNTDDIKKFILDLSEVEYCDSSGLSAILLAFRFLNSNGGHIRIASPSKQIRSLIQISQLDRVLPISNSVHEAMTELNKIQV